MLYVSRADLGAAWRGAAACVRTPAGHRLGKVLLGATLLGVGLKLYSMFRRRQRRQRWAEAGKDVVVLHMFQRATNTPNLSPFALKLETWLRMADIRYVVDTDEPQNYRTDKCPWITLNGVELTDSELIMHQLQEKFHQPVQETHLTAAEHGVGRAVQTMMDEHASIIVFCKRYLFDRAVNMPAWVCKEYRIAFSLFWPLIWPQIKKFFDVKGVGRLTQQEALFFLYRDLQALEDLLGEKPFLLGEKATSYDAAVFAELTQVLYGCAPEVESHVRGSYPVIVRYHERMKAAYWQDWDQCCAE